MERREDILSRERIAELEERYRIAAVRLTAAVATIGATLVAVSVVLVVLLGANTERSREARELGARIQAERARSIRENCVAGNARHDHTIATLDQILKKVAKTATPAERKQLKSTRDYNVLLINALAPNHDCAKLVRESVGRP